MEAIKSLLTRYLGEPSPELGRALLEEVCRNITTEVGSTRASVWLFSLTRDTIRCLCLHDTRDETFSSGAILHEEDFAPYFQALLRDMKVVANDAAQNPATRCFDESYFVPNDIRALLDQVVLVRGEVVGVLCCEQCGATRNWSEDDLGYLEKLAWVIGRVMRNLA